MANRDPARRPRHLLVATLAGAALLCVLAAPATARAGDVEVMGYLIQSAGFRHSWAVQGTGLDLRIGLGGYIGVFGLELETGWTADRTARKPIHREAARHTTWLNANLRILGGPIRVVLGGGGGLGWIKDPGPDAPPKFPSHGMHYYAEFDVLPDFDDYFGFGIRLEPQHLWQSGIVSGVEHSLSVRLVFFFGGYAD